MKNTNINTLNNLGQSIWYDNLSRDVLESGELANLISSGVSGLTSNPTIFQKAISGSSKYDQDLRQLKAQGLSHEAACESLMISDVAAAADLLLPTFKSTNAADGYASIEVSPFLADDTQGTIEAANRLWGKLDRPNIMIKIPATPAGIPAIRQTLEAGINVNVTLIFSVEVYKEVAQAFIQALENRASKGLPINNVASVASFFVSRVDSICEKELNLALEKGVITQAQLKYLAGNVGIANSLAAFDKFKQLFLSCENFKKLKEKGVNVQRPLWASTGTKNPEFDPLLYVKALGLADTVNTLPPATLTELLGTNDFQVEYLQGYSEYLSALKECSIDLELLLNQLQIQGVKAFTESFTDLLSATQQKMSDLV